MPTKLPPEQPDLSSFAGRRAAREAREAVEGPTPRRELLNRVDTSEEFTAAGVRFRRVQA